MKKLITRLAVGTAMAATIAAGAGAATPANGTLGKASPKLKFSGIISSQQAYPYYQIWSSDPTAPCPSGCDSFALKVTEPGKVVLKFGLAVEGDTGPGFMGINVKDPSGKHTYTTGESTAKAPLVVTINAVPGDYAIGMTTNFVCCLDQDYTATGDWTDPNAAPAPAPTAPTQPGQPGQPGAIQPVAPQEFTVDAKAGKVSAKKAKKGKKLSFKATSSRSIQKMTLTLKKGSKAVGSGSLAPFPGSASVKVKLSKALKKGSYTLVVAGQDGAKTVAKTIKVKVSK